MWGVNQHSWITGINLCPPSWWATCKPTGRHFLFISGERQMLQGENGPGAEMGQVGSVGTVVVAVAAGRQRSCKIGRVWKCWRALKGDMWEQWAVGAKIFNCKMGKKVLSEWEVIFRFKLQDLSDWKSALSLEHRNWKVLPLAKEGEGACFHCETGIH